MSSFGAMEQSFKNRTDLRHNANRYSQTWASTLARASI
jgi:hypothetical protein